MATVEWLTFSEMARKAAMTESEVRKIVRDFGHILCARQFGDIMKYPLEAVELISLIKRRAEEGWSLENLRSLITKGYRETFEVKMPSLQSLYGELLLMINALMGNLIPAFQKMQETMQFMEDFIDGVTPLIARVTAQEDEIRALKARIGVI